MKSQADIDALTEALVEVFEAHWSEDKPGSMGMICANAFGKAATRRQVAETEVPAFAASVLYGMALPVARRVGPIRASMFVANVAEAAVESVVSNVAHSSLPDGEEHGTVQ